MTRFCTTLACLAALALGAATSARAQDVPPPSKEYEAKLIGVLKSDAPIKDKADACRELSLIGTSAAIAPLAALLGDEKLSHLARYGLEPIPDAAVDEALRDALGKLKGRPLVGVIGSLGVRKDARAIASLSDLLKSSEADVGPAAARALGRIGGAAAVDALKGAFEKAPAANRPAISEGLLRCADQMVAHNQVADALAICDRLSRPDAPAPVRDAAARKARFLRLESGPTL
jgi:HEAT repeat protein